MAALPYMQLYIADYLADTMHLSTEEHGAYLLLMFNYWQTGKAIPKNRLAKIARMTNERWEAVEPAISEFFEDDGENWVHLRIERDIEHVNSSPRGKKLPGGDSLTGFKGYVYFVTSPEMETVKIGYSKNPWARIGELRRNYGSSLSVVATIKTVDRSELSIHTALAKYHVEGEWFVKNECINSLINKINEGEITTVAATNDYANNYEVTTSATTNTDKDKDLNNKNILGHGETMPPDVKDQADKPAGKKTAKKKNSYPEDFEFAWCIYPKRAGGNSKTEAFKAWNARIRDGTTAAELIAGVKRYAAFCEATSKTGTEYIKQAATFFGPGKHYAETWEAPQQGATQPGKSRIDLNNTDWIEGLNL